VYKSCSFGLMPTHKPGFMPFPQIFDLFVDDRTSQTAWIVVSLRWCLIPGQAVTPERSQKKVIPETLTMTEMIRGSATRDRRHPSWSLTPTVIGTGPTQMVSAIFGSANRDATTTWRQPSPSEISSSPVELCAKFVTINKDGGREGM
jgi:hypothetical protein